MPPKHANALQRSINACARLALQTCICQAFLLSVSSLVNFRGILGDHHHSREVSSHRWSHVAFTAEGKPGRGVVVPELPGQ